MKHSDDFLERIRQTELSNLDKLSRFFSGLSIETTNEFIGSKRVVEDITEKKFKPDIFFKYGVLMFAFGLLGLTFRETFSNKANTGGLIFGYAFSAIIIFTAIKQFFYDKSLNFEILIDRTGIIIDNKTFLWKDIYETAILTKRSGKYKTKYLIVALNNMTTYEKFELTHFINHKFWGFSSTLSKYIEYFKPPVK